MKAKTRLIIALFGIAMLPLFFSGNLPALVQNAEPASSTEPVELIEPQSSTGIETGIFIETAGESPNSPYFVVISNDSLTDGLPLKSTSAKVNIAGVIADVELTQKYVNSGKTTLEAIYVFPLSTKAAVYAMEMQIGSRRIRALIREKGQARRDYEQAKEEGRRASLLEQDRPNVFSMRVANITPGDTINLLLRYTELLVPEKGEYSFVFPTVVGPRYTGGSSSQGEQFTNTPYTRKGVDQTFRFNFELNLNAGMPVQEVNCRTHEFITDYPTANQVSMKLDPTQKSTSNRDIIINYSLRGNEIQSGLLLYEKGEEQHFLMMIQPPKRIQDDAIPPREYIFVLDISGSMHGFPLDISKTLMRNLIVNLKPTDLFNLVLFAGGSALFSPGSVVATPENIDRALKLIDSTRGGGGTELLNALERAYRIPKSEKSCSRSVILLSDGYINAERKSLDLVNKQLGNANFFSFGIGSSVNRYLMEGLAFMGKGEAIIVDDKKQAGNASEKFRNYIQTPLLSNISIDFGDWQVFDVEPGGVPDLMAERPLIIHGKYRGLACGKVKIKGNAGKSEYLKVIDVTPVRSDEKNRALPLLWAKERIQQLEYYDSGEFRSWQPGESNEKEILRLGLQYSLMTSKTSFIAIDEKIISNKSTKKVSVKQPLPLPHNVSELAVGEVIEILNVVEDDMSIEISTENEIDKAIVIQAPVTSSGKVEAEDCDVPFVVVEQMPSFPGGQAALTNFLTAHINYPAKARAENVQGRVIVQFTVDKNGDIKDVEVVRSVSPELDAEAIRVVMSMPRWIPGKQRGKTVAVKYTLPINFKLNVIEKSLTTN